jgi:hypothetical protein
MIVKDRQYRPQTTAASSANDPLSVAAVRELGDAINNAKAYAMAHKTRSCIFMPPLESADGGSTDERVVMVFAPVMVPDGYNFFRWYLGGQRISGAGSTRWTLYCADRLYRGPDILAPLGLGNHWSSDYIDVSTDAHQHYSSIRSLKPTPRYPQVDWKCTNALCWFVLTATNSDGGTRTKILTLDIVPRLRVNDGLGDR